MSRTVRKIRRSFYQNTEYYRDGSPGGYNYRDINNHGKYSDENANNKRAMSRLARRKSKRLFIDE